MTAAERSAGRARGDDAAGPRTFALRRGRSGRGRRPSGAAAGWMVGLIVLLAAAGTGAAAPSLAPAVGQEAVEDRVRRVGREAAARFAEGEYGRALAAYEEVAGLLAKLEGREVELAYVRYNIARCLEELGRLEAARAAYERVDRSRLPPGYADDVPRRVAALEGRLLGALVIDCGPHPDARVALPDAGREGVACGARVERLPPGEHRLVASRWTGERVEQRVDVPAGGERRVTIAWSSGATARAPATAAPRDRTLAWVLTGAGAAALLAGGVFNGLARGDVSEGNAAYERQRTATTLADYQAAVRRTAAAYDRAEERALVSYVLFGTGALLAGGALWAWLAGGDEAPAPRAGAPVGWGFTW